MKIKKLIAGMAAAAMTVSAMTAVSASAASVTSVDFENGNGDASVAYFCTDDNQGGTLSVEDYNGSKQLKVTPADVTEPLKVWIDLDSILDRSATVQISAIECDLTFAPATDDDTVGYVGGSTGAAGGFDLNAEDKGQVNPKWSGGDGYEGGAYNPGEVYTVKASKRFLLPTEKYTEEGTNPFLAIMKWGNSDAGNYVLYIDNIVFKDADGNAISFETKSGGAAPAETPAATTTTAPATGNVPAAAMLSVMAAAGIAAAVSKKRK